MATLYEQGWTAEKIANEFGISPPAVLNHLHAAGVQVRDRRAAAPTRLSAEVRRLREQDWTLDRIAEHVGCATSTVWRVFNAPSGSRR